MPIKSNMVLTSQELEAMADRCWGKVKNLAECCRFQWDKLKVHYEVCGNIFVVVFNGNGRYRWPGSLLIGISIGGGLAVTKNYTVIPAAKGYSKGREENWPRAPRKL